MNILAFGASSSKSSINQKLAVHAARQIEGAQITTPNLNDFEMPIYSTDKENADGIPAKAQAFKGLIANADGIIISFAEHNGSYTAAFKNILDWVSRLEGQVWLNKPMLLMASSPGGRGGQTVLNLAHGYFPFMGGDVTAKFSLPSFYQNFDENEGIKDQKLNEQYQEALNQFTSKLEADVAQASV